MKTNITFKPEPLSPAVFTLLLGAIVVWAMPATARGQIFVVNFYNGAIGEYTTSGATVNAALISGVIDPEDIAVSGGNLFVTSYLYGTTAEYTTSGATVNASLISELSFPEGIAVSGGHLFVTNNIVGTSNIGTIGEYTTTGAIVNASLISGLNRPAGIAVSGGNLFVANSNTGTIGEYTTTGAIVNASLISGLNYPTGIAVSGANLFVANYSAGTIGEYTTSGATVNASLVSGLSRPDYIAVSGGDLFVTNEYAGTIGEYTTSGATVNAALVTGLNYAVGIAVEPVAIPGWTGSTSANWADSGNWSGAVPGATSGTTNTDTATFNQDAPNSPLTIDAGRNLQNIIFDTADVNSLTVGTVGGQALLLSAGGTIQTTSTVVNAQTVNAPLVLEGDFTFTSGASSNSATLSFGGRITPGATSGVTTLTLNGSNTGANTISGVLADNGSGQLAVTKSGTGVWILAGANTYSGGTTISGGTLKFNINSGMPTISAGASATVASGATLELAGSVSALGSADGNRTQILNNSTALGLVVSGTNQVVGGIDGTGNVQVNAGSNLTADHIIQSALIIGGTAGNPGLVTIDASDTDGNPLTGGLSLAGSLASNGPFAAGFGSTNPIDGGASNIASSAGSDFTTGNSSAGAGSAAVPEPSTLALAGCGLAIAVVVFLRCCPRKLKTTYYH